MGDGGHARRVGDRVRRGLRADRRQLRAEVDDDVRGDVNQLSQTVRSLRAPDSRSRYLQLRRYLTAQPFTATSSLLFVVVPGQGTATNHPVLFGLPGPGRGGNPAPVRARSGARGRALLTGRLGLRTAPLPDAGQIRIDERVITIQGERLRLGAGESLDSVARAQRSLTQSFLIAGLVGLLLVLIASYLAGASVSRPLRRMARVAARVDDGDLKPRMSTPPSAASEIRTLAESFNRMLDRLAGSFQQQRDFIADASHELRTPLTVIAGQLEVLAAQPEPADEEIQRVQRLVGAEVARTSRMVDDMLLLTRSEHGDFLHHRTFELPEFIADLWSTTIAGHHRRFELGPVPSGTLTADSDRIAQALRNLLENARAHTSAPDGLVRLEVVALPGRRCRFVITDDGPGIPEAQRERIFDRFHRTDESRARISGGTGLGLAIVQAVAEAHGGQVSAVGPRDGIGARFELTITRFTPAGELAFQRAPGDPPGDRSAGGASAP